MADSLSRHLHLGNDDLLTLLPRACPHLLPENPQITSLPIQNSSWIGTSAQLQPKKRELTWQPKPSTIAAGVVGLSSPKKIQINDPYLEDLTPINKARIFCAFMDAYRNGYFSKQNSVKGETAAQAADKVATTITESGRPDPRKNEQGHTFLMIKRQKRSYKNPTLQRSIKKLSPPEVYRTILRSSFHPREKARAETLGAALFFYMRSCEYSKTPKLEEQKTRPIRPCDITFRLNGQILPHDHPNLHLSTSVSLTFGPQKSEIIEETVTQFKSNDPIFCPCILWTAVIRRLRSYPNYNPKWPIFTFYDDTRFTHLTSKEYSIDIKAAVDAIGPAIHPRLHKRRCRHTLQPRRRCLMTMYLTKTHPYTIMMIGRWSSLAFLKYIEKTSLRLLQRSQQKYASEQRVL
mmetsp:Transcript_23163/g.36208  ORF Transcript_23163/g.36208 Transcript_23163/m.36208 type:complete len:405 (-) Transcript_23163:4853-6067(-)